MSRNLSDSKQERDLLNRIARLEQQMRERGTLQVQGDNAIQIGYTPDNAFALTITPYPGGIFGNAFGLIGTFMCTLQYDNPQPGDVVFGDIEIAVNKDVDDGDHALSMYYGGLHVEELKDLALTNVFNENLNYHPIVRIFRLYTFPSEVETTFYVHTRWRYVGVGKTLMAATGNTIIIPDGPVL